MKQFKLVLLVALSAAILQSCTSVEYRNTADEMAFINPEGAVLQHYSISEMSEWNVLVLDSGNTELTAKYAEDSGRKMGKYNKAAAQDFSFTQIMAYQDSKLREVFGNVSYEGFEGEHYDLIIVRDYFLKVGMMSGHETVSRLTFYFIEPAKTEEVGGNYLVRGMVEATGIGIIPYPAVNPAVQVSNIECMDSMAAILKNGLDLYQVDGDMFQAFAVTTEKVEQLEEPKKEISVDEETEFLISIDILKQIKQKLEALKMAD